MAIADSIFFAIVFLWIAIAYSVYQHANRYGKDGTMWGLATVMFGPLTLIAYSVSLASDAADEAGLRVDTEA